MHPNESPERMESWYFNEMSRLEAQEGHFDEAVDLTQRIHDKSIQSLSYKNIAQILTNPRFQNFSKAFEIATLALNITETFLSGEEKDSHLVGIAKVMIYAENYSQAQRIAEKIQHIFMKSRCLSSIAHKMIEIKNFSEAKVVIERAREVAEQEPSPRIKTILLGSIDENLYLV